jgi:putative salt-induced outer membrane protein YdiY
MKGYYLLSTFMALGFLVTGGASGDTILLNDGSQLVGTIEQIHGGKLAIVTDFAGRLEIDASKMKSLTTDGNVHVELASGDQLVGPVQLAAEAEEMVVESAVGAISFSSGDIAALWAEGGEHPDFLVKKAEMEAAVEAAKPKWSATLEAGGSRTEGNTDTLTGRGLFEVRRTTADDLLKFYLSADYGENNEVRNRNEYKGGILFESSLTERWYWYARTELEYDEFENIDLRATAAAGAGYYWLKKPDHELKTRAGGGYRHEAYDDGTSSDDAIVDLGLDYLLDIKTWTRFTHSTTYTPDIERWSNYRLSCDTAFAFPLANTDVWKLKIGMRNDYNSHPQPGLDRLDNTYYANIVLEIK